MSFLIICCLYGLIFGILGMIAASLNFNIYIFSRVILIYGAIAGVCGILIGIVLGYRMNV